MKVELRGKTAIFDLDGTLLPDTFPTSVKAFAARLAEITGADLDPEEIWQEWRAILRANREKFQVDPVMTSISTKMIMEKYGLDPNSEAGKQLHFDTLKAIYNPDKMPAIEGAVEALESAEANCPKVLIGTIAKKGWTRVKLQRSGIKKYFPNGNVFCFEVRVHKALQWPDMFDYYGLTPEEVFIVGDTYGSDIEPMLALGVKAAFWVNNGKLPEDEFWSKEVPIGVIKISTIGELVEYLQG